MLLKNGDILSGVITVDKFTIQTIYAALTIEIKQIESIILERSAQNIGTFVVRNGDKLSGKISPTKIKFRLFGGQNTEIDQCKIKEISMHK